MRKIKSKNNPSVKEGDGQKSHAQLRALSIDILGERESTFLKELAPCKDAHAPIDDPAHTLAYLSGLCALRRRRRRRHEIREWWWWYREKVEGRD